MTSSEKLGATQEQKTQEKKAEKLGATQEKAEKLGQFFTKNKDLQKHLIELIKNNPDTILEPSVGRGDLISALRRISKFKDTKFDSYEIDKSIDFIIDKDSIVFGDFLKQKITKKLLFLGQKVPSLNLLL